MKQKKDLYFPKHKEPLSIPVITVPLPAYKNEGKEQKPNSDNASKPSIKAVFWNKNPFLIPHIKKKREKVEESLNNSFLWKKVPHKNNFFPHSKLDDSHQQKIPNFVENNPLPPL